jgi:hypothetical protein
MSITQKEINKAIDDARVNGAYAVLVVSDLFDYTAYIVEVKDESDYQASMEKYDNYSGMSKVQEIHRI